ncbi:xanthine dehydrogenase family protein molybdopterin-binding subunit [Ostreiculturibacter nitratireducens]|uniref:xanthine dehydrogenase family protein molybdopterin-binding subunit n=1 Tax=Ostreiculturibacter nitratireducens TaxID=3075226 RepID=UPI0031B5D8F4
MSKFGKSQSVKRLEDIRLLTGHGRFVDDIAPQDALVAFFLRSPVAHAEITALDTSDAAGMPGVVAVLTSADLEEAGVKLGMRSVPIGNRDGSRGARPERPVLAKGRVRFVGEPIACVVAETLAQAKDAAEAIAFDFAELPVHLDISVGGEAIHPEAPGNLAFDWAIGDEAATEAAFAGAAHRVSLRTVHNRIIVNSMEPRVAFAEWDSSRLHFCFNGQGVWNQKDELAESLGLPKEAVRVTTPDVGGGFGMKSFNYPEYLVISHAARALGRPVRWTGDRTESMLSDNAGRDLISDAELAFDADHRIVGYRVNILSNLGAYNSNFGQLIQSEVASKVMTGVYDIKTAFVSAKGIYTNTTQTDAYRGAGRPESITTLERLIDKSARVLGVDPWELRDKNYIRNFPYDTVAGEVFDVGDFPRAAARARTEADLEGFAARRAASAKAGKLRGLGTCYYIEAILGDANETAEIAFNEDGTVSLFVGTQSNGQGHETVFAQFLSDTSGIPLDKIRIVQGDSDLIAKGGGTGGSRSVTVQSTATLATVEAAIEAFTPFVADALDVPEADVDFDEGAFRALGSNRVMTLLEAAEQARASGRNDLLRHKREIELDHRSYPNGAHIAEVEVDPETGQIQLLAYTVTDDFGNLMHPQLVEGQIHGGVAQGLGQAVCENAVHDASGQLLTATFMDYAMPRAEDIPMIRFTTEPVPATGNPLGMKGCGEAGTVGALAAITNAVLDALWDEGVREVQMPLTPLRVWTWLKEAREESVAPVH